MSNQKQGEIDDARPLVTGYRAERLLGTVRRRLSVECCDQVVIKSLEEASRCMEEALFSLEEVCNEEGPVPLGECAETVDAFLSDICHSEGTLEDPQARYGYGEARKEALCVKAALKDAADSYSSFRKDI